MARTNPLTARDRVDPLVDGRMLSEKVRERERIVDSRDSQIRHNPDDVQRNLIPFAKLGFRGIWRAIPDEAIAPSALQDIPTNKIVGAIVSNYTVSNYTERRTLDGDTATLSEMIDVVCTLIADLQEDSRLG